MGRGGGGGGSRGGGGRSGGSRGGSFRSSSSGGRSSFSSSSRSSGRGSFGGSRSSFSSPRPPRPPMGGGWHRPPPPPRRRRVYYSTGGSRVGCLPSVLAVLIILIIAFAMMPFARFGGGTSDITRSTIQREKLDGQYVTLSNEWYDDSAMGWIASRSVLESGLKDFYNETGVQPYLVITDSVYGDTTPTGEQVWEYANEVYDEMFTDEGHMVFVFQCEDGGVDYMMAACTGAQAKVVLDDAEALEILYDYVDHYFYSDLDEDEMFAEAFRDAGERIMHEQTPTGTVAVIVIGLIAGAVIVFLIIKNINKRSKEKAEETERILNTPVEKFGDTSLDDLKDKYDGM